MSVACAIREFCRECYGDSFFRQCKVYKCVLNQFLVVRRGEFPDIPRTSGIRKYCLECAGSPDEVRNCTCDGTHKTNGIESYKCPLYDYRFGNNPFSKRKGNAEALIRDKSS